VTVLVALTNGVLLRALWVRRTLLLRNRHQIGCDVTLIAAAAAMVLIWRCTPADTAMHSVTHRWGAAQVVGHLAAIGAQAAMLYHALTRLYADNDINRIFQSRVWTPLTVAVPLMVAWYWASETPRNVSHLNLYATQGDIWLRLFTTWMCAIYIYLAAYGARIMLTLRHDPRSRRQSSIYLAACLGAVCVALARAVAAWQSATTGLNFAICVCGVFVVTAVGAIVSHAATVGRKNRPLDDA
jgi:hypothetical protein